MTRRIWLPCLCLAGLACEPPPDPGPPYEGSCPILIECAQDLQPDLVDELIASYAADGSCWDKGANHWNLCRSTCVDALVSLNVAAAAEGQTCGTCETTADCRDEFMDLDDVTCVDGFCARRQLGDIDTGDGDGDGNDTDASVGEIDPECTLDQTPIVVLETNLGDIVLELDEATAPAATYAFVYHLSANFYDNTIIHRVLPGYLIQSGGYGPGPVLKSPLSVFTSTDPLTLAHADGVIAMDLRNDDGTIGSQWYISLGADPSLAGQGVVFGRVIAGAGIIDEIAAIPTETIPWMGWELPDVPEDEVLISTASCVAQWP